MIEEERPFTSPAPGHNRTLQERAIDELDAALEPFADQRDRYLRNAQNAVVQCRETAGAAADVIRLGDAIWHDIERMRLGMSNPYRDTADAMGARAVNFWEPVTTAFAKLRQTLAVFHAAESKRIADQEAENQATLAKMREAAGLQPASAPAASKQ